MTPLLPCYGGRLNPNPPMDGARIAEGGVKKLQTRRSGLEFGWIGGWRRSAGAFGGADGGPQWLS